MTDIAEQRIEVRGITRAKAPEPTLSDSSIRGERYWSADFLRQEQEALWPRVWQVAGRVDLSGLRVALQQQNWVISVIWPTEQCDASTVSPSSTNGRKKPMTTATSPLTKKGCAPDDATADHHQ